MKRTDLEGLTRRDARLPELPNKVHTVPGMRRVGKTTFLRQVQQEIERALEPERAVYPSLDLAHRCFIFPLDPGVNSII